MVIIELKNKIKKYIIFIIKSLKLNSNQCLPNLHQNDVLIKKGLTIARPFPNLLIQAIQKQITQFVET